MIHYKNGNDIVDAKTELARAYAMIGLLRLVKMATPVDMVCTYIQRTHQPWALRDVSRNINDDYSDRGQLTIRQDIRTSKLKRIPEGIVRMSKDYLIREFWKQIDHIRSYSVMHLSDRWDRPSKLRLYPKTLLRVLRGIRINQSSRIWDARNAIGELHAVCTPVMLDQADWQTTNKYGERVYDKTKFDVMRSTELRNIAALQAVFDNYCWNVQNRQKIPDDIEKGILLDLLECLLIMFGCDNFSQNYALRQVYEYARTIDDMMKFRTSYKRYGNWDGGGAYDYLNVQSGNCCRGWTDGINAIIDRLLHLSPEAAICAGCYIDGGWWRDALVNNPDLLRTITPNPYREVGLYLHTELITQMMKKRYSEEITKAFERGELTNIPDDDLQCNDAPVPTAECCY